MKYELHLIRLIVHAYLAVTALVIVGGRGGVPTIQCNAAYGQQICKSTTDCSIMNTKLLSDLRINV